jgi:hypothetical protein
MRVTLLLLAVSGALLGAGTTAPPAVAGAISTVAGTGIGGFSGDGGPAIRAQIDDPSGIAPLPDGSFLIADQNNDAVRRVSATGTITTVAGTGVRGFSGDGGPATSAKLNFPTDVEPTPDGGFLIADANNFRIRRVSAGGTITTIAGRGSEDAPFGDGGLATGAAFYPAYVALTRAGGYLISDTANNQVREVLANGTIRTVAGNGRGSYSGDGGPATAAGLGAPGGVAPTPDGGFLVADTANQRVRRVSATGTITTVAGTGRRGSSGDGGAATRARLNDPYSVSLTADGGFLIADGLNSRIRKVSADGTIRTVAGTGTADAFGDGGPPTLAALFGPLDVATTPDGGFLIADSDNNLVRRVAPGPDPPALVCGASRGRPRVGRTVVVRRLAGTVFVRRPRSRQRRLRGSATIPVGSTVDTTRGRVRLISAACRPGATRTGDFYGGAFVVSQDRRSADTNLTLTGGGVGRCSGQAGIARRRVRRLYGSAHGGYRTRGGFSAATIRGSRVLVEDTCQSTTTRGLNGIIIVTARGDLPQTLALDQGDQVSIYCTAHGPPTVPAFCLWMEQFAGERNTFRAIVSGDFAGRPVFTTCLSGPGLSKCFPQQFGLDPGFYIQQLMCTPRRAGVFTARWRTGGRLIGTLQTSRMPGGGNNACDESFDF